jgi:hypothetical protein
MALKKRPRSGFFPDLRPTEIFPGSLLLQSAGSPGEMEVDECLAFGELLIAKTKDGQLFSIN